VPLNPQAQTVLDNIAKLGFPQTHLCTPEEARANGVKRRQLTAAAVPEPVHLVEDRAVPGPAGSIPVRVYTPAPGGPFPVLMYFHGGGWVIGDLDSHDGICRALCNRSGCVVVSVHYRLAPEHKYPAAADDCYAATRWVAEHAADFGGNGKLAVGGDSAGGNLAAVVTLMARRHRTPRINFQLLIYPVTDYNLETSSYHDNAHGYFLWRDDMAWFWKHYLPNEAAGEEVYASPLRAADLRGLPPALVITAEYDPLRDEGEAYAERLAQAEVPVTLTSCPGLIHGFFGMAAAIDDAKSAIDDAAAALRKAFA
jgi:acetyl esterase